MNKKVALKQSSFYVLVKKGRKKTAKEKFSIIEIEKALDCTLVLLDERCYEWSKMKREVVKKRKKLQGDEGKKSFVKTFFNGGVESRTVDERENNKNKIFFKASS